MLLQGVSIVGCSNPNVKVYALSANKDAEIRVVFVKKSGTSHATVTVTLQGIVTLTVTLVLGMFQILFHIMSESTLLFSGSFGPGSLRVLTGASVTATVKNITLAGQQASVMSSVMSRVMPTQLAVKRPKQP